MFKNFKNQKPSLNQDYYIVIGWLTARPEVVKWTWQDTGLDNAMLESGNVFTDKALAHHELDQFLTAFEIYHFMKNHAEKIDWQDAGNAYSFEINELGYLEHYQLKEKGFSACNIYLANQWDVLRLVEHIGLGNLTEFVEWAENCKRGGYCYTMPLIKK